jgi:hypothetical protein
MKPDKVRFFLSQINDSYISSYNKFKSDYKLLNYTTSFLFTNQDIKDYLQNYSLNELRSILLEFNKMNFNQKSLFLNALDYNSKFYSDPKTKEFSLHKLDREAWRIKKGLVNVNYLFVKGDDVCGSTIRGFIRALKSGCVFITKMNIDGDKRRVLVKTKLGAVSKKTKPNKLSGFNELILDLKTFDIYNLSSKISPLENEPISLKHIGHLNISNQDKYQADMRRYSNFEKYKPILEKEIKDYFQRHKENTSFEKRHNIKKPGLFSRIKKRIVKK